MHSLRQPADVVMALDYLRGIAPDRYALNHVRVEGALREKFVTAVFPIAVSPVFLEQFLGSVLKYFNEFVADHFSLGFGIGHAFEQREETIASVYVFQTHMKILAENALHNFFLARAEQSIVHKNTGELVADRLVQQRSSHCRINAAAQSEHDLLISDLFSD